LECFWGVIQNMTNGRMNSALRIGLNLKISNAGMLWIKRNDPDLWRQIKEYKRKRR
jgi:hypothetical protein